MPRIRPEKKETLFLQRYNTRPQACLKSKECIAAFGCRELRIIAYIIACNRDLAQSDSHLFRPLED